MGFPEMPDYLKSVHFVSNDKDPHSFRIVVVFKPDPKITKENMDDVWKNYLFALAKRHGYDLKEVIPLNEAFKNIDSSGGLVLAYVGNSQRKRVFGGTENNPLNIKIENNFDPDNDKKKSGSS